jgi:hypothetical protein
LSPGESPVSLAIAPELRRAAMAAGAGSVEL